MNKIKLHSKFWIGQGNAQKPKLPKPKEVMGAGVRRCNGCKEVLSDGCYHPVKTGIGGLTSRCKACMAKDCSQWWFKHKYGLSLDERTYLIEEQNSSCAICEVVTDKFFIDYDYENKRIKGLLCVKCNLFINIYDLHLERLASYLTSSSDQSEPNNQ